ncbi:helicase C-terminal domain-containing protein [Desulfuribacillus alkaliarsenatis]|uniref:DNA 5'-3' helicase n=1 Tax=Desulfuribacillus alkaliarsenatis TaxID=766136 RepID=A0A1E5FZR1_9FIRM|nr:helicase C-terminal domain-containing protein [Desulfuribacillus alkaliarsenatis]OEF95983.1 hypothetical protein BHF68_09530 [Desulfuribacillus alkaliarsenatis]
MSNLYERYIIMYINELLIEDKITKSIGYVSIENTKITDVSAANLGIHEFIIDDSNTDAYLAEVLPLLDNSIVVFYSADEQLPLLNSILESSGYNHFNGLYLDLRRTLPVFTNSTNTGEQHLSHLELMVQIFWHQYNYLKELPILVIQKLIEVYNSIEDIAIKGYLLNIENEKMQELGATTLASDSVAFSQLVLKKKVITEVEEHNIGLNDLLNFFQNPNREKILNDFEARPQQQKMLEHVHTALKENKHLLVEAGTGTGKTLAYLLPLLYFSLTNEKRVVVATNTVLLQKQIFERDIPLLQKIYKIPFNVAIFKGRGRYLCLRKLINQLANDKGNSTKKSDLLATIIVWLCKTETGEGEELQLKDNKDWQQISSDSETCLNKKCYCFSYCYYHFAKEKANHANLIITNHSLVFSDIKTDHQILPAYKHIVFDEAHHLENEATKHLGTRIQYHDIKQCLTYLYRDIKNGALPKAMDYIRLLLTQGNVEYGDILEILNQLIKQTMELTLAFDDCMLEVRQWILSHQKEQYEYNESIRFTTKLRTDFTKQDLFSNVTTQLKLINTLMEDLEKAIHNYDELDYQLSEYVNNVLMQKRLLQQFEKDLQFFFSKHEDDKYVYWFEIGSNHSYKKLCFNAVPIYIGEILNEKLFDKKSSCILTSATLAIRGSFKYAMKKFGLDVISERVMSLELDSPFDYKEQCLVCIPTNIPSIKDEGVFINNACKLIIKLLSITDGKTLLLFTSNRMLASFHSNLKQGLATTDIKVLAQNIDSNNRSKLLEEFFESKKAILLGSNSFWEGVDMPGDALTNLFIIKLPFWPPNMPIVEARTEQLEKEQKNSFMEYALPEAIIRFKQGFGRLIRTKTDRGIVVIFDRRVIDSKYGSFFIKALPGPTVRAVSENELFNEISEWNQS